MGKANRRDGGRIIIGVEDTGDSLKPVGLSQSQIPTWVYDDVADGIARYVDPSVEFDLVLVGLDGNQYVVIEVKEFSEIPILCK